MRWLAVVVVTACGCEASQNEPVADDGDSGCTPAECTVTTTSPGEDTTAAPDSTGSTADEWQQSALGPELGMAMSVWGPDPSLVLVVGGQREGETSSGFVLRRDGKEWTPEVLPDGTPMLHWVGHAGDDVWTVGVDGAALRRENGAWVPRPTTTEVTLWGVWGSNADDAWAVGGDGVAQAPQLLHWDGEAWSVQETPTLPRECHGLFKVWGSDAEHVFVVGDTGVILRRVDGAWVLDVPGGVAPFISVWGRAADDVVAVGGRSNARIARWDGAAWSDVTLLEAGLNGVWMDPDGSALLVGRMGSIYVLPAGTTEPVPGPSPTLQLLHAAHGWPGGPHYAVGGSFEGAPPWAGVVLDRGE